MKPHLRREWSILFKRNMWFCSGDGMSAFGDNPHLAYWNWKIRRDVYKSIFT
jgi:hypothetical protein